MVFDFREYCRKFEKMIVEVGVKADLLGKKNLISVKRSRLRNTSFGMMMGNLVDSDIPFAIDYYGYVKVSKGLKKLIEEEQKKLKHPRQLRVMETTLVHFASIKIEDVSQIGIELAAGFSLFKRSLIKQRGFNVSI